MLHRLSFSLLLLIALVLAPQRAPAEVRNCTASHVSSGLCTNTAGVLLSFYVPDAETADIQAAISALVNYTPTTNTCTAGRVAERLCGWPADTVQLGQVIPSSQVASRWIRAVIIARLREYRAAAAAETARQASLAGADPAIP